MSPELFNYQREGARWLQTKRFALLADEMGLGKSAQTITAATALSAFPCLVLCPAVASLNWMQEWQRFSSATLRLWPLLRAADASVMPNADVTICSYGLTADNSVWSRLSATRWRALVLDESHFLKGTAAARSKRVVGKGGLVHLAERTWMLSGTPAPNHPGELWVMCYVFGLTRLGYEEFVDRYCTVQTVPYAPGKFREKVSGGKNIDELKRIIAPVLLRRKKDQVMKDLPPLKFDEMVVPPGEVPVHKWEYHFSNYLLNPKLFDRDIAIQMRKLDTLVGDIGVGKKDALLILQGLAQEVKSLRQWIGLQKIFSVLPMIAQELRDGAYEKLVIFGVHKSVIHEAFEALRDEFGAVLIYGGTPPEKRDKAVRKFQKDPKCRVFVGQVLAAGTAINLTAAHNIAVIEWDWVPANNQQAVMRCHRIGQTKPVTVRSFAIADTIDERIQRVLKQKTRVLTELFDTPTPVDPFS